MNSGKISRISKISVMHYIRLVYRSAIFVLLLISYISYRIHDGESITAAIEKRPVILVVAWSVFTVEMVLRFFPSRLESPGSRNSSGATISNPARRTYRYRTTTPQS